MFDDAKKLIDQYFNLLKEKAGEEVGLMYGVYDDEDVLEIDLIIGDESEKVFGIRFFNVADEIIFDLLQSQESNEIKKLSPKEKKKKIGKVAFKFHYESKNFGIDHDFLFYSKNGKISSDIVYAEMIPKDSEDQEKITAFTLDKDLFELQVQA